MAGTSRARVVLQPRDRRLLEELETMRVVDREQAKLVAGFNSTTRANARLLALSRAGYLKRMQLASNRAAYLPARPSQGATTRSKSRADTVLYCEHQLAINEVYLTVRYRSIPVPGIACASWQRFTEPISKSFPVIPDAYFELATPFGLRACFLEVDLGTESVQVLRRKLQLYLRLAVSGEFPLLFSPPQFRVLVITTTERRLHNLKTTAAKLTDKLFWFSTLQAIQPGKFFARSWLRPSGSEPASLV